MTSITPYIPLLYQHYKRVFNDEESKKFPPKWSWDHTIELKPGAPPTLISKNIHLSQTELRELQKFIKEHVD